MRSRFRSFFIATAVLVLSGGLVLFAGTVGASPSPKHLLLSTPTTERPGPVPTVYPPSQADNGAQVYWGMCQDCHGDQGQGLDAKWRSTFAPAFQDCWGSGCHGENAPDNSFELPAAGAPALAGPGALPQFSSAFSLGTYIHESMPFFPSGSLTNDQAWELTAYILQLNDKNFPELTLSGTNSAAIPVHQEVKLPEFGTAWHIDPLPFPSNWSCIFHPVVQTTCPKNQAGKFLPSPASCYHPRGSK